MSKITYVTGNLLESDETDIAHGCNIRGVMGGGTFAGHVARKWPMVREVYNRDIKFHHFVLGTAQPVTVRKTDGPFELMTVWNLATQREPGPDASLWGVLLSFGNMFEQMVELNVKRVAVPRIGCGVGGLEWSDVSRTICDAQMYVGKKAPEVVVYTLESEVGKYE